jgi:hypothetical protein
MFPNVRLQLPPSLVKRRISPVFHTRLIRPYHPNDETLFPLRDPLQDYDFGDVTNEEEEFVDEILDISIQVNLSSSRSSGP